MSPTPTWWDPLHPIFRIAIATVGRFSVAQPQASEDPHLVTQPEWTRSYQSSSRISTVGAMWNNRSRLYTYPTGALRQRSGPVVYPTCAAVRRS
jgi:hypothetical protein